MPIVTNTYDDVTRFKRPLWRTNGIRQSVDWNGSGSDDLSSQRRKIVTGFRGNPDDDYAQLSGPDLRRNLRSEYVHRFDTGHEFRSVSVRALFDPTIYSCSGPDVGLPLNYQYEYRGPFKLRLLSLPTSMPSGFEPSMSQKLSDGRYAISATAPTSPEAGLAQFLGELRERLPQAVGFAHSRHGSIPKKGAEEYLNFQFGLQPTANDLAKMAFAVTQFHKVVEQMKRDSNLTVRRALHFATRSISKDDQIVDSGLYNKTIEMPRINAESMIRHVYGSPTPVGSQLYVSTSGTVESWFTGAFTYHLAQAHDFLGKLERYDQLANKLLGTRITPELVWELTPWSWLIDWVSDAGTFFKNISLFTDDSLVLRYGYIMHHTVVNEEFRAKMNPRPGWVGVPSYTKHTIQYEVKSRVRSTPYGFGLDTSGFSAGKWAILGALGLTKGDRKLRFLD